MVEKEFSKISNAMIEALSRTNMSPYESRAFWFIFRSTFGWRCDRLKLNASKMARGIGIDRGSLKRALRSLSGRRILNITRHAQKGVFVFIECDVTLWLKKAPKQGSFDFKGGDDCAETCGL